VAVAFAVHASAAVIAEDATVQGAYLRVVISPNRGGTVTEYGLTALTGNYAGEGGLAQEGFGVASYYVPGRRLNEKLETVENVVDRTVLTYSYDCDGPNIRGLHVTRTMEPLPNEASLLVRWKIENQGDGRHWVAPWVRNPVAPGGKFSPAARIDVPTLSGIRHVNRTGFNPASRNWIAVTDPSANVTVYGIFNADTTHSFLAVWDEEKQRCGFQTAFVPRLMNPGDVWETTYRINAVRGLKHVDFATDELAAQLDYQPGKLLLLLSAVKPLVGLQIHASVVAENGRVRRLPARAFSIDPNIVVRSTYDWTAPGDGTYEFMAQLTRGKDERLNLGKDTAPPHGGIDTQFVVGSPRTIRMEPWTDAPFALERGARTLKRPMACTGDTAVWIESSLEKIFHEDVPEPDGAIDPTARIQLARNERESFQVVLRPPKDTDLHDVACQVEGLVNRQSGAILDTACIEVSNVAYCPIRIPSYFEGPTGDWPDALPPFKPFTARGGQCNPIWFTVYAPPNAPPGVYAGALTVTSTESEPIRLTIEATVYDFDLPVTPGLKTDFGFRPQLAFEGAKAKGCVLPPQELAARYVANALDHRVTLREPGQLPAPSADYTAELRQSEPRLKDLLARGATTFSVPASLLDSMGQLQKANAFVGTSKLKDRVFCPIADEPIPPEWPKLTERMDLWRTSAPDIPLMVTTFGMQPFLPEAVGIWAVHLPILDTVNNRAVLDRVQQGREVWWYVNHSPPRPYGNLFIDFAGIEHRILFWQTWVLGIRGFHYWCVNYCEKDRDPYADQVDVTPVNGDGFLVYPGPNGPVNSIRWEIIRDGIEDYDYLTILTARLRKAQERGASPALIDRAAEALNLKSLVPDLVSFSRDPKVLATKRDQIARAIVDLGPAR
jgi:hypothetical protein